MPQPKSSLPPYCGDELLDPERTYHCKIRLQRGIAYLFDLEQFLQRASDADFDLYVRHSRTQLADFQPKAFLGVPTGPNANRLLASGNRWYYGEDGKNGFRGGAFAGDDVGLCDFESAELILDEVILKLGKRSVELSCNEQRLRASLSQSCVTTKSNEDSMMERKSRYAVAKLLLETCLKSVSPCHCAQDPICRMRTWSCSIHRLSSLVLIGALYSSLAFDTFNTSWNSSFSVHSIASHATGWTWRVFEPLKVKQLFNSRTILNIDILLPEAKLIFLNGMFAISPIHPLSLFHRPTNSRSSTSPGPRLFLDSTYIF
ncbi:uncharacterized protein MYCFIDRAFT_175329 [Pseudocercospora fijiensis CIRAD86]|uniref:Uncharacterized protein n=1 Tax=Pseudocercospora fijiensis (strain CIRAD86) TaxID=383855 RepID=M3AB14_PSEFD|nr:uncharacterized protein MYCFIDRAFT_175329 [Pseudocercospora fijiensis CIRAD86]EME81751.1 hypothetical protein MYCFIDRAFT_175329 [Pseudocercospora fijiensis CIRAD86]